MNENNNENNESSDRSYPRIIDWFSTPDNLKFGFEIVVRIMFKSKSVNISRLQDLLKQTFVTDKKHLETPYDGPVDLAEYWRVYWDKEKALPFELVEEIEDKLNAYAAFTDEIELIGVFVIPRRLGTIRKKIGG